MTPEVVCIGLATLDTIAAVDRHPGADELVWATDFEVAGGGPAATAAVTLARLGVATAFVGAVGDDDVGAEIREGLVREGVDVSELAVVPGARSPQSVIVVGDGLRTIAAYRGAGLPPLELSGPARERCLAADWVHVDQTGYGAAVPLRGRIRLSVDGGIPIDGLDLRDVALYAPTESALRDGFGNPAEALAAGAELVVVTRGAEGSVAYARDGAVVEAPGEPVEAVSTLGAGDVFHGALLARLVSGAELPDALAFANRVAARSCSALDGRSGIPTAAELAASDDIDRRDRRLPAEGGAAR